MTTTTETVRAYVLCWRPDRFWLIGPFADATSAYAWATDPTNNPSDDPNWFILPLLANPTAPVTVIPPSEPMPNDTATWRRADKIVDAGLIALIDEARDNSLT